MQIQKGYTHILSENKSKKKKKKFELKVRDWTFIYIEAMIDWRQIEWKFEWVVNCIRMAKSWNVDAHNVTKPTIKKDFKKKDVNQNEAHVFSFLFLAVVSHGMKWNWIWIWYDSEYSCFIWSWWFYSESNFLLLYLFYHKFSLNLTHANTKW